MPLPPISTPAGRGTNDVMSSQKHFDPKAQFTDVLAEMDTKILGVAADLERLRWLRDRIAEQFENLERQAEQLQMFDEAQAAAMLGGSENPLKPEQLARLRRRYDLPHVKFGNLPPRYTARHLAEICEILTVRKKAPAGLKRAA